jgi:hypothetical protein
MIERTRRDQFLERRGQIERRKPESSGEFSAEKSQSRIPRLSLNPLTA